MGETVFSIYWWWARSYLKLWTYIVYIYI